jgi:hypothetical protein
VISDEKNGVVYGFFDMEIKKFITLSPGCPEN